MRDPVQIGKTWYYEIHIKQAVYGPYSKGVILFSSGDDVITAHVQDVKEDYAYWHASGIDDNIAAVGWAEYNGAIYNFMFLYSEGGIWIILSNTPYFAKWSVGGVYQGGTERVFQLLSSPWIGSGYDMYPRF